MLDNPTSKATPIRKCPRCDRAMQSMSMVGVTIDVCDLCNGCWLDGNEATSLTRSRGKNAVSVELTATKDSPLCCPSCGSKSMLEGAHSKNSNLILDQCKTCTGVWLDKGELTTLLALRAAP